MEKLELKRSDFLKLSNSGKIIVCQLILSGVLIIKRGGKIDENNTKRKNN